MFKGFVETEKGTAEEQPFKGYTNEEATKKSSSVGGVTAPVLRTENDFSRASFLCLKKPKKRTRETRNCLLFLNRKISVHAEPGQ